MLARSLTSAEANQRLISDIEESLNNVKLFTWKAMFKMYLPRVINSLYMCYAAISLLVVISYTETDNYLTSIFQLFVVLVVLIINVAITFIEGRVLMFWHKNRCMSKLAHFESSDFNWTHLSYPSQPLTTLRSQITVKGLRDKELVNIPQAILVCGDIVKLNVRFPAPANVKIIKLQSSKLHIPEELKFGEVGFHEDDHFATTKNTSYWYKVTKTPFPLYISNLGFSNSNVSIFCQQKQVIDKILNFLLIPSLFLLSLCFNLIRWLVYPDYFAWIDIFVSWPLLTVLSVISPCLPILWTISNAYGVGKLDCCLHDKQSNNKWTFIQSIVNTIKAIAFPYKYPKMEVLHSFSNITAVCAVDKEYILTGSFPTAEKIFFFNSSTSAEDANVLQDSCTSPAVEITTEILDISPASNKKTGLSFDDPNWQIHINSLKAIGLNLILTSHLPINSASVSLENLHYFLSKTQCCCSLAHEIGISKFASTHLKHLYSTLVQFNCDNKTENIQSFLGTKGHSIFEKSLTCSHLFAILCHDQFQNRNILLSRGSGDIIAQCCSDLWDGQDLQPMTDAERSVIIDFFARRSMSSYCIALAYNPLFQVVSQHQGQGSINNVSAEHNLFIETCSSVSLASYSQFPSDLFNQVFVGMVSLQYQPKSDIVSLVQNLRNCGIRFIYFTAENEVRGRIFAEKLGLEAGWNCHISLSPDQPVLNDDSDYDLFDCDSVSSSGSSLTSLYNVNQAYIKAQLPKGIDNVRAHLKHVDNVPLLVPLFTDCSTEAIKEMIKIMQENGEIVLCMGNAWVIDNLSLFKQAEIGLSLIPAINDVTESDCAMLPVIPEDSSISPMSMAATLISITSEIQLKRDANVSLHDTITQARHLHGSLQKSLLFALGSSLMISCIVLLAILLFLPSPLSYSHELWLLLFVIPVLSLFLLSIKFDDNIESFMPDRAMSIYTKEFCFLIIYFVVCYIPACIICVVIFWVTLNGLCLVMDEFSCHPIFGNINSSNMTTLGWQNSNYKAYAIAQDCTALFLTLYVVVSSLMYIHRFQPIWKCYKYTNWPFILAFIVVLLAQSIYFIISELIIVGNGVTWNTSDVPLYSWLIGIGWLPFQLILQELAKYHIKRKFVDTQRKLRLAFQTKLGMNSPF